MKALRTFFGALTFILFGGLIANIILTVKQFNLADSISKNGMNLVEFVRWGNIIDAAYSYQRYCYLLVALMGLMLLGAIISHMVILYEKEKEL